MSGRALVLLLLGAALAFGAGNAAAAPLLDRPEGPLLIAPARGSVARTSKVVFRWQPVAGARFYDVRVARNRAFTLAMQTIRVRRPRLGLLLPRGTWRWKVRSVGRIESRWSKMRRFRVVPARDILPPTRPLTLQVVRVDETEVELAFVGSRDEFTVKEYRVEANGQVVAVGNTTRISVANLTCATVYTFSVRAADKAGNVSQASPVARAKTHPCTDFLPPSPPAQVGVSALSDTTVALAWTAATDPDGQVAGYAVYRNGALLGISVAQGFLAKSLAPATEYTFVVRARDRAGHLSEPSAPLTVTTAAPLPATGPAYAYLLASTGASFEDFQRHYTQISTVFPTYFDLERNGTISGQDNPLITGYARQRGVRVEPRLNCQDPITQQAILPDPQKRKALIATIVGLVAQHGYDGANIDFEAGSHTLRNAFTAFIDELAATLHAQGATLTVNVSAKTSETFTGRSGFYDYPALAQKADRLFVLAWDLHWATSPPGPISDVTWVTKIADYVASLPNASRFVIGTNLYGFDWPDGASAIAYEYDGIMALLASTGSAAQWDGVAMEPYFTYTDGSGKAHTVYYATAQSVDARLAVARGRGLGVGVWRLGNEDQDVWSVPSLQP